MSEKCCWQDHWKVQEQRGVKIKYETDTGLENSLKT